MSLKHKVDERAFLYGKNSVLDVMTSATRKDVNNEIRKAIENFKKSPEYDAAEDFVKMEIEELGEIFPPRWKIHKSDIDTEDSVKTALSVLSKSKLVDASLRNMINESLTKLETTNRMRR